MQLNIIQPGTGTTFGPLFGNFFPASRFFALKLKSCGWRFTPFSAHFAVVVFVDRSARRRWVTASAGRLEGSQVEAFSGFWFCKKFKSSAEIWVVSVIQTAYKLFNIFNKLSTNAVILSCRANVALRFRVSPCKRKVIGSIPVLVRFLQRVNWKYWPEGDGFRLAVCWISNPEGLIPVQVPVPGWFSLKTNKFLNLQS